MLQNPYIHDGAQYTGTDFNCGVAYVRFVKRSHQVNTGPYHGGSGQGVLLWREEARLGPCSNEYGNPQVDRGHRAKQIERP